MKHLLSFIVFNTFFLLACSAPPTCYSRVLALGKEITESYKTLQRILPAGACRDSLPTLYLDIHNSCVMTKLRIFISTPNCERMPRVLALKMKARKLYTIMNSACRRDLVFFTDDCEALEYPPTPTPALDILR